ncbi:MAG: hypothetical protein IKJ01_00345 [Lachnospiraceae bacterium]|nr:hypothetical protein [Lachnospiraceae bacterium]
MKMKGNFQIENAGTALLTASVIFLNLGKRKNYKNSSYEKKASSINKNETDADDGNNHLDNVSNIQKQTILQLEKELQNCKYACSIFDILKDISDVQKSYICCGISETVWKGRMELINDSPFFMIDGAHNSHGVHALAESLKTLYPNEKFHFIMAVMADKDYENMIEELIPLALDFITVTPESNRALQAKDLAECIAKKGIKAVFAEDIKTVIEPLLPKTRIQQDKMDKSSLQQNSKGNLTSFHIENSNTENWNTAKTIINAKKSTSSQKTIAFGSLYFIGEIEAML